MMETADILKCEDINALYEEKVSLTEKIGNLHRNVKLAKGEIDETDYKAELTTSYAILEALNHRLKQMESVCEETKDEESRIRYNFMRIARSVLRKETYEKIRNMAQNPLKEMKPMLKELEKNKIE